MWKKSVAYITGAGQGLGRATALHLASLGSKIVLVDISQAALDEVLYLIGRENAIGCVADVTSEEMVSKTIDESIQRFGKISLTVNCAGISPPSRTLGKKGPHSLEQFAKVLNINTIGTFNVTRLTCAKIALNEPDNDGVRGVVVNTASIAAMDGQIGQVAYAASKGAIVSMTLPLARDLASYGIRVCTIAPGLFATPMMAGLPEIVRKDLAATVPLPKRLGNPEEYAKLVQCITENNMMNGEVVRLDGALRMQ